MRYRSHVLHSLLEGFVLRKGHEILKTTLPPKFEHVLYLRPSQVQADLYNFNMSAIAQAAGNSNSAGPLKAFAVCSKVRERREMGEGEKEREGERERERGREGDSFVNQRINSNNITKSFDLLYQISHN